MTIKDLRQPTYYMMCNGENCKNEIGNNVELFSIPAVESYAEERHWDIPGPDDPYRGLHFCPSCKRAPKGLANA